MGGIESTHVEKKPLLPKTESKPASGLTVVDVTQGNLPPAVENLTQHSTTASAPALEIPQLVVDADRSIRLVLPEKIAANESRAREVSDAIYYLFFRNPDPGYFRFRDIEKSGIDNFYVEETGLNRTKAEGIISFFNRFIILLEACGISSEDFASAAVQLKEEGFLSSPVEEFLTTYLHLNTKPNTTDDQKIINKCNELIFSFDFVYKNLQQTFDSKLVTNLHMGTISGIASNLGDLTPSKDQMDPKLREPFNKGNASAQMLALYVVLRHQQSWLSKSHHLNHLEMAAKATVLLHDIDRRVKLGVPTPPDPSELIAKLAARAESAVAEEDLEDAVHCAEILETLTGVSEDASARLAEVKGVIAQYDAEAEKLAEETKFDG
jgi:hypothetical protein